MAKVTSKLQITLPKALAERFGIRPGDEIEWRAGASSIRILPGPSPETTRTRQGREARLRSFDGATERQVGRQKGSALERRKRKTDRGWTRDELYDRGGPR